MSFKRQVNIIFYNIFAVKLPISHINKNIFGKTIKIRIFKKIRGFFAKNILEYMGENVNIEKGAKINKTIKIGDNSSIGIDCVLQLDVIIGKDVMMGPETLIYTQNHETKRTDIHMIEQGMTETNPVIIEDDVWIGRRVIILPGVRVGRGSILGAGTIVAKNIPPYSVVVGNPGRVIKNRKENLKDYEKVRR